MLVLGIESSCDDSAAAVLRDGALAASVVSSQHEVHGPYGGVVPELASREHVRHVLAVIDAALSQAGVGLDAVDGIAVTRGPGLVGSLLVGLSVAKGIALRRRLPLVGVHHLEGHLLAVNLERPVDDPVPYPFLGLIVSGGHSGLYLARAPGDYVCLGRTRDDAVGEAFDKVAKMLDLPYPGGPAVQRLAADGSNKAVAFPRPMLRSDQRPEQADYYDFSFSGLKTAVATQVEALRASGELDARRADVAASFQHAAVDVLVSKTLRAVHETGCSRVLLGGGVSANTHLRQEMAARLGPAGRIFRASPRLSLDNGAMVARAGRFRLGRGETARPELSASATLSFPGLVPRTTSGSQEV